MKALARAIIAKARANSLLNDLINGRIYWHRVEANVASPYIVFNFLNNTVERGIDPSTGRYEKYNTTITTFNIYTQEKLVPSVLSDIMVALWDCFDEKHLTFVDAFYKSLGAIRVDDSIEVDAEDLTPGAVTYNFRWMYNKPN